jgi:hypothetical protein
MICWLEPRSTTGWPGNTSSHQVVLLFAPLAAVYIIAVFLQDFIDSPPTSAVHKAAVDKNNRFDR